MEIIAYEMEYGDKELMESSLKCISFQNKYFKEYMKIYNECFYEMRKVLDIQPYNFLSEYEQIENKIEDIFLFVECDVIVGSVACYGNEIDDLIVNPQFQHKGYGKQLLLWGMNKIRECNDNPITLHVAQWNENAIALYEKVGFNIVNMERIR